MFVISCLGIANVNKNVTKYCLLACPSFHSHNMPTKPMKILMFVVLVHKKVLIIIFIIYYKKMIAA